MDRGGEGEGKRNDAHMDSGHEGEERHVYASTGGWRKCEGGETCLCRAWWTERGRRGEETIIFVTITKKVDVARTFA